MPRHIPSIAVRTRATADGKGSVFLDFRVDGRRVREVVGPNTAPVRNLAKELVVKRQGEIAEGKYFQRQELPKVTFKDFAMEYMESYGQNLRSKRRIETSIRNLERDFGHVFLSQITIQDVERYKTKRNKKACKATTNREVATLKAIFSKAVLWGKAESNPVKGVKLFKENNTLVRYFKNDQAERVLEACPAALRPIVVLARNTGMRQGEIVSLKWGQVDFETGFIRLLDAKNGEGRDVPLNETAKAALASLSPGKPDEFVFEGRGGRKPAKADWVYENFKKVVKKVGLWPFRFHDLRHDAASRLVMKGVDLQTVKEILGHKTLLMTLRYSHLSPNHKLKAVKVLDDVGTRMDNEPESSESAK